MFDDQDELRRQFHLKVLREAVGGAPSEADAAAARTISDRCEAARRKERELFQDNFSRRLASEIARLIDEAGTRSLIFTPSFGGIDRFERRAIERDADQNVRFRHMARLTRIDAYEISSLDRLFRANDRRSRQAEQPDHPFARASDRRQRNRKR